jgi:dihydroorotate dehydrogenase (fumarate)
MKPDLTTRYLGLDLESPIVASASPVTGRVDGLQRLEQAGAAAAVLPSLFEEQIEHDDMQVNRLHEYGTESFPEALSYFPELDGYNTGPDAYLRHVEAARHAVGIPILGSLNGCSPGGWVHHAQRIQSAGADALELNVYFVPTDPDETAAEVEARYVDLVRSVRAAISIPLAVKVGPYFSSPANVARRLVEAGADGLVLFNRFLQPDIDLDQLALVPSLELSRSYESRLPMQWIAILREHLTCSLAATSGVHEPEDAIKLLLAGADVTMTTSAVLERGPQTVTHLLSGLRAWMEEKGYASVEQLKGSMSRANCPDPTGYERANYMRTLVSYSSELP